MDHMTTPPLLAIINTSPELVELLRGAAEDAGYRTVVGWVPEFREGRQDLAAFLREHEPDAVLWDIALPYEENWRYVQGVRARGIMRDCPLVLTTTNKRVLEELVGPTDTLELIGKPFDLNELFAAVARTLQGSGPRA